MIRLDPFYPILGDADLLETLVPLGVHLVQLRVKDRPEAEIRAQILRAKACCAAHGAQLVVNDHWRLALVAGCDFVHLGQEDLDTADIPALRAAGVRFGLSTHDEAELDRALRLRSPLIGVNNRDLRSFEVSLDTTLRVAPRVPADRVVVAESGLSGRAELDALAARGVRRFLIGESLMRQPDVAGATRALIGEPA